MKNSMAVEAVNIPVPVAMELQVACEAEGIPSEQQFHQWTVAAIEEARLPVELVIRIVDEAESRALNHQFRDKGKPTNVLSFPFATVPGIELNHLGDLVICAPVVKREAVEQHKPEEGHWAHMVVHGMLHLQGYDHQLESDAATMESQEIRILKQLGYADPYA
jgi:probable rRNA maturation factor